MTALMSAAARPPARMPREPPATRELAVVTYTDAGLEVASGGLALGGADQ